MLTLEDAQADRRIRSQYQRGSGPTNSIGMQVIAGNQNMTAQIQPG